MSKRIGIFADVSNLYYCIGKKFHGKKLDYEKYYAFLADFGEISQAIAYGAQMKDEAANFIHALKKIGFTPKYKCPKTWGKGETFNRKADWDVGMAMDMVNLIERLDMIILGTADGDLAPAVEWAIQKGVQVIVVGCGISRDLKNCATRYIEIPESLLEEKKE